MKLLELTALAATRALNEEELTTLNAGLTGMERAIGLRYTRLDPAGVSAELEVAEQHLQPVGLVNGGVFAALGESVGSTAGLVAAGGKPVVGVNNNTDFISSVREGLIEVVAEPIQLGGRTQIWQVTMTHQGKLVARTTLRTMLLG
ncbi:PaaI family thioesterase [Corynebacterium sp. A21]|uniref:PaaI family thioesterase n=1 Tax=Corynebacterium sp. A21 TaxID=3457318 RepID=UPI003FCF1B31